MLAASNAAIGAKLITLKPVGKKSPSRRIVASQLADEVASGDRQDMESTTLTFKLEQENPTRIRVPPQDIFDSILDILAKGRRGSGMTRTASVPLNCWLKPWRLVRLFRFDQ